MAKEIQSSHSLSSISDKMIADFSTKLNKESYSIEQKNIETYKNLTAGKDAKVPAALSEKHKEIEHEI